MEKRGTEIQSPAVPKPTFHFQDIFYYAEDSEGDVGDEEGEGTECS